MLQTKLRALHFSHRRAGLNVLLLFETWLVFPDERFQVLLPLIFDGLLFFEEAWAFFSSNMALNTQTHIYTYKHRNRQLTLAYLITVTHTCAIFIQSRKT